MSELSSHTLTAEDQTVTTGPTQPGWQLATLPPARRPRPTPVAEKSHVLVHRSIGDRYRFLELHSPQIAATAQPGQFVMITVARDGESAPALPRPMAIYRRDIEQGTIEILYGVVGDGTRKLGNVRSSEELLVVGPLGREFDVAADTDSVLLIGRGIGTCSLTTVAQANHEAGIRTIAVASGRTAESVIGSDFYRAHGAELYEVTDESGSSTPAALFEVLTRDLDEAPPQVIMTCGSDRLTRLCEQLAQRWGSQVQVSVEAHMACGIGYCHGCASGARSEGEESPLICKDGPVFHWRPESADAS
ncbi:MAG: dihydroorotate dehydrogenase electron transfer subunit [Rhodococcus sp. (in: high G+C Gram-positive bacteria)]|nr:dihydroorotate dehydrogenase electron transfer subunit [Rhodococcus sp. (in: high G+C Gram-positive bacteria)]